MADSDHAKRRERIAVKILNGLISRIPPGDGATYEEVVDKSLDLADLLMAKIDETEKE